MISFIIAGAGKGKRINSLPKAFIKIGGKELIYHSLDRFYKESKNIVAVLPEEYISEWRDKLEKQYRGIKIAAGGSERQDSVKAGLAALENNSGITIIHDVARPFFSRECLEKVINGAQKYGACIPCMAVQDTLKEFEGAFVKNTLDRTKIVQIQTPQAFKSSILKNAYRKAYEDNFYGSDDAVLVERAGFEVYLTQGNRENIKITYPFDIQIAEMLVKKWKKIELEKV